MTSFAELDDDEVQYFRGHKSGGTFASMASLAEAANSYGGGSAPVAAGGIHFDPMTEFDPDEKPLHPGSNQNNEYDEDFDHTGFSPDEKPNPPQQQQLGLRSRTSLNNSYAVASTDASVTRQPLASIIKLGSAVRPVPSSSVSAVRPNFDESEDTENSSSVPRPRAMQQEQKQQQQQPPRTPILGSVAKKLPIVAGSRATNTVSSPMSSPESPREEQRQQHKPPVAAPAPKPKAVSTMPAVSFDFDVNDDHDMGKILALRQKNNLARLDRTIAEATTPSAAETATATIRSNYHSNFSSSSSTKNTTAPPRPLSDILSSPPPTATASSILSLPPTMSFLASLTQKSAAELKQEQQQQQQQQRKQQQRQDSPNNDDDDDQEDNDHEPYRSASEQQQFRSGSVASNASATAAMAAAVPSLPVASGTSTTTTVVPNFGEYDEDDEERSPPRVPPGMTPSVSSNSESASQQRRHHQSEGDASTSARNERAHDKNVASPPIPKQPMLFDEMSVGRGDNNHNNNSSSNGNMSTARGAAHTRTNNGRIRSFSEESEFGISFVAAEERPQQPPAQQQQRAPSISSSGPAKMTAATMFGAGARGGVFGGAKYAAAPKPTATATSPVGSSAGRKKEPAFGTEDDDIDFGQNDDDFNNNNENAGDDESPPGMAFSSLIPDPFIEQYQRQSQPAAVAAIIPAARASSVPRSGSVDRLRFGYATDSSEHAAAAESKATNVHFSPPTQAVTPQQQKQQQKQQQQQQEQQQKKSTPTTTATRTALDLLQANMKLNREGDSEMRAFVSGLKDEKGRPVKHVSNNTATTTASASASPERNAFLLDLEAPPPAASSGINTLRSFLTSTDDSSPINKIRDLAASAIAGNSNNNNSNSAAASASVSPSRNTNSNGNNNHHGRDYGAAAAAMVNVPSAEFKEYRPEATPATRAMQRWQIDRTPLALPRTAIAAAATASSVSPQHAAATSQAYSSFPVLPAQKINHHSNNTHMNNSRGPSLTNSEMAEFAPDSPARGANVVVGGAGPHTPQGIRPTVGGRPHSRMAQQFLAEKHRLELSHSDMMILSPKRALCLGGGGDTDKNNKEEEVEDSESIPVASPSSDADVNTAIDAPVVVSVNAVDDEFDSLVSWWTTKKIIIAASIALGIVIVIVLLVLGFVVM